MWYHNICIFLWSGSQHVCQVSCPQVLVCIQVRPYQIVSRALPTQNAFEKEKNVENFHLIRKKCAIFGIIWWKVQVITRPCVRMSNQFVVYYLVSLPKATPTKHAHTKPHPSYIPTKCIQRRCALWVCPYIFIDSFPFRCYLPTLFYHQVRPETTNQFGMAYPCCVHLKWVHSAVVTSLYKQENSHF